MKTTILALQDLSCQHCVKRVQQLLEQQAGVESVEVSLERAKIVGEVDAQQLIAQIQQAGYGASLAESSPKSELPTQATVSQPAVSPDPVSVAIPFDQANNPNQPQYTLLLQGLSCAACVAKVQKALQAVAGVEQVQVNLAANTALIFGKSFGEVSSEDLIQAVNQAGYGAELLQDEQVYRQKQQNLITTEIKQRRWQALLALLLGCGLMLYMLFGGEMHVTPANRAYWLLVGALTALVIWLTGGHFYQRAWRNLRNKSATMDSLVTIGTGMAWLYSMLVVLIPDFFPANARHLYFESSAMIIGLINLGKMLEAKAKQRSSQALERLLDLTPKTATVVQNQQQIELPISAIQPEMILRLQTGQRVPVDGIVTEGEAWLDESMLTGEPIAVFKTLSDKVSAGTLVTDGTLLFKAQQVGDKTRLAQIIKLVRQAQSSKPQIAQLADQISSWFVPAVIVIALLTALIWYALTQQISYAFTVLTTVLIIACPCALGLATPMSIIAGVGRAAELGILVRDAEALQKAAQIDCIVLDKTGTLTQGKPKLTDWQSFNGFEPQSAVYFAASLEQGSRHPLAKALLDCAPQPLAQLSEFKTHQGLGVSGKLDGKMAYLGNQAFLQQQGIDLQAAEDFLQRQSALGATVIFLALEQQLAACFAIQDPLREDSQAAITRLQQQGYQLVMLTGDQQATAQAIAQQLGIEQVIAGVLPEGKAQVIAELQQQGRKVLMVGDGINDAPALAQANVSIAMGGGSDIAIETAELTIMRHSLQAVGDALALARATLKNMQQNLFFAFIYNSLGIPLAAGVLYPWLHLLLNPMLAGTAMAFSSITVATNANRLLKFKPKI